jgi:hypothetical protein
VDGAAIAWSKEVAPGSSPGVVSDGAGGALLVWRKTDGTLWAQRFDAAGSQVWPADVPIATGAAAPEAVTDGAGGMIVAYRKSSDLHAARIGSAGTLAWGAGVVLASAPQSQTEQRLAADGQGGVLAVWTDYRDDAAQEAADVYALRLTSAGLPAPGWTANGVAVCTLGGHQSHPALAGDGAGGAIVAWEEPAGIGAQRITAWGERDGRLPAQGVSLCGAGGGQTLPSLALTRSGVAVAVWGDARTAPTGTAPNGVYANRVVFDAVAPAAAVVSARSGCHDEVALQWIAPGDHAGEGNAAAYDLRWSASPITDSTFAFATPLAIGAPRPGGAPESVTVTVPLCSAARHYALRTRDPSNNWSPISNPVAVAPACPEPGVPCEERLAAGPPPAVAMLASIRPNPSREFAEIGFGVPAAASGASYEVSVFDLGGRLVRSLARGSAVPGFHRARWDLTASNGSAVPNGVYFVRLSLAGATLRARATVVR